MTATPSREEAIQARVDNYSIAPSNAAMVHYADDATYLLAENEKKQARIDKALACYGPDPKLRLGESRYRSADDFLIAIRAALTDEGKTE